MSKLNENLEKNITEHKMVEEKLRASEEKYRGIFERVPVSIILLDRKGQIVDVNPHHISHIGKGKTTREDYIGKNILTHPSIVNAGISETYADVLKGKSFDLKEMFFPTTTGGIAVYVNVKGVPLLKKDGDVIGALFIHEDITEQKKAEDLLRKKEQQMRLFMLSTNDSIWNCDMVAGTVERSIGFERAFGYAIDDIHSGIEWWAARLHPDDKERVWQTFNDAVASEKAFCGYEYRFRCRNGSYANIEDSVCIIRDDTGKAVRSLGAMRNITERKKTEKILQEQKEALEKKNVALSEVLGQIEIEKKQIKDNVIANAETLLLPIIEKLSLEEKSSKYVQLLRKNLQELTSSLGARLSDKRLRLTSREIDICNMIKNGLTSKEIAGLLNISIQTIEKHRSHIRKKLGIVNRKLNLSSVLKTI